MTVEPRPEVATIRGVVHGAIGAAELAVLGLTAEQVVDFSVNTNPLGSPPGVPAALAAVESATYPDPVAAVLRHALAARTGLDPAQLIVGNGSSELIWLLALAYTRPAPERVLIVGPTFGEYERACRLMGADVAWETATAETGFTPDAGHLAERIRRERPMLVWLCNPNNPTSRYLRHAQIEAILDGCITSGALLVVDEAYLPFVKHTTSLLDLLPSGHLFLLRSLTKDYALAGLRLGYGAGTPEMVEALRKVQPPWSVNAAAQAAGVACLEDEAHLERARAEVWLAREELVSALDRLGLRVTLPAANFVLVEAPGHLLGMSGGNGERTRAGNAAAFRERLLAKGFVVRDCTSFGLPDHVRIAVRTRAECARLVRAIEAVLPRHGAGGIAGRATGERIDGGMSA